MLTSHGLTSDPPYGGLTLTRKCAWLTSLATLASHSMSAIL